MHSTDKKFCYSGFTLIEMAIVVLIIGILIGGFFSAATLYVKQQRIENMDERVNDIRIALSRFIIDDPNDASDSVRYPCPSPLTANASTAELGVELCPPDYNTVTAGDDLGGVFVIEGSIPGSLVLVGAVPTRTLGIKNDLMLDEFGNRFTYAVTINLTETNALLATPVATGQITIKNEVNGIKTTSADFILVSHGEDGSGSYSAEGMLNGSTCRTTTVPGDGDSQNCLWQTTGQAIFRDQSGFGFSQGLNDQFYDDVLSYTLAEDDGWWQSTNGGGSNIVIKNPDARLGVGISTPVQKLDINGAIRISNTSNICDNNSVGSIRFNSGSSNVIECCNSSPGTVAGAENSDGFAWNDIGFGCNDGQCDSNKIGQMRANRTTGIPEFCNGTDYVSISGASCTDAEGNKRNHLEEFEETETMACDGDLFGDMSRQNTRFCNNGTIDSVSEGEFDRSGCNSAQPNCAGWNDIGEPAGIYNIIVGGETKEVYCQDGNTFPANCTPSLSSRSGMSFSNGSRMSDGRCDMPISAGFGLESGFDRLCAVIFQDNNATGTSQASWAGCRVEKTLSGSGKDTTWPGSRGSCINTNIPHGALCTLSGYD